MRGVLKGAAVSSAIGLGALPLATAPTAASATVAAPYLTVLHGGRAVQEVVDSPIAGYVVRNSSEKKATGTFAVPRFICTGSEALSMSVQLETKGGAESIVGFVQVSCSGRAAKAVLSTFVCAGSGPCETGPVPSVGDEITMTESYTASTSTSRLEDDTTGQSATSTGPGATASANSNFIDERNTTSIPTFKTVVFSSCEVNGEPIGDSSPIKDKMTTSKGVTQVATSKLNSTGDGFITTFKLR